VEDLRPISAKPISYLKHPEPKVAVPRVVPEEEEQSELDVLAPPLPPPHAEIAMNKIAMMSLEITFTSF
jgi:hypothetical protein